MRCLKCQKELTSNDYIFPVILVQTLPVRDITGERKVQALGETKQYGVCAECARKQFEEDQSGKQASQKIMTRFGGLVVLGTLIIVLVTMFQLGPVRYVGFFSIIAGCLGLYENIRKIRERKQELTSMSESQALKDSAWKVLLEMAPKKDGENDITYIPIDKEVLKHKKGDLTILYHLLPEIAIEAYQRIEKEYPTINKR